MQLKWPSFCIHVQSRQFLFGRKKRLCTYWANEATTNSARARALTKSLRRDVRHWKSLGLSLFGRACGKSCTLSRVLPTIPFNPQSIALVRQGAVGRNRRTLWELDLKALYYFSAVSRNENIYHSQASQIVCLSSFCANCSSYRPPAKINRDTTNITIMRTTLSSQDAAASALTFVHHNPCHWCYRIAISVVKFFFLQDIF